MSCLLGKTDYCKSLLNKFKMIKKCFYVLKRLIFIYLPELSYVLKKKKISSSYYISSQFITLFTNSLSVIIEKLF